MIETERLLIRESGEEDYDSAREIWMDPEVRKFSGGVPTLEEFDRAFRDDAQADRGEFAFRAVVEKRSGRHIGDAGLIRKAIEAREEVELVYFFNRKSWGNGYATEAARALLEHGFTELRLKRIVALIHPDNAASIRVAQRVGLTYERDVVTRSGNPRRLYAIVP